MSESESDGGEEDNEYPKFTFEELAQYDGMKNPRRYLCILGEIYDVTEGKNAGMYEKPKPYSCFVGRDATVAFITGDFTGAKTPLKDAWDYSVLGPRKMADAVGWTKFYAGHDTYKRVGTLVYPDGKDPKLRAVSPYDPLIEQCTLVDHYQLDWICGNSSSWTPGGILSVNYRNKFGGLNPVFWGAGILEQEAAIPPRAAWVTTGIPEEGKPHSMVALWMKAPVKKSKSSAEPPFRLGAEAEVEVPDHFVFWGVNSTSRPLTGKEATGDTKGEWTTAEDARRELKLPKYEVICLVFVWILEALPSRLPRKFWRPNTVGAIHFCFAGPEVAVRKFIITNHPGSAEHRGEAPGGGGGGDCGLM